MELEYKKVAVKDLVERVLLLFKEKTMKHGIRLTAEYDDIIEDIEVDDRRIKQVLLNLVSNAVKFTNDGGSVVVRVRKMEGEKRTGLDHDGSGFVEFSVQDIGPGIRAQDIPTLFQPFHQLESTYEKKHQGTGLGLALCKTLVELHGGRIWVESEFGKGSTFTFVVPTMALKEEERLPVPILNGATQILNWKYFLTHLERIISFHKRRNLQFGILEVEVGRPDAEDQESFTKTLKETIRESEILAHGKDRRHYYVLLMKSDAEMTNGAGTRIKSYLENKDYSVIVKKAMYPEDGETADELLNRLREE